MTIVNMLKFSSCLPLKWKIILWGEHWKAGLYSRGAREAQGRECRHVSGAANNPPPPTPILPTTVSWENSGNYVAQTQLSCSRNNLNQNNTFKQGRMTPKHRLRRHYSFWGGPILGVICSTSCCNVWGIVIWDSYAEFSLSSLH